MSLLVKQKEDVESVRNYNRDNGYRQYYSARSAVKRFIHSAEMELQGVKSVAFISEWWNVKKMIRI